MSNTALNDMKYNFEPLILFQPKSDYKVDEQELKKSINKSKELIARIQKKKTVQPTVKQENGETVNRFPIIISKQLKMKFLPVYLSLLHSPI